MSFFSGVLAYVCPGILQPSPTHRPTPKTLETLEMAIRRTLVLRQGSDMSAVLAELKAELKAINTKVESVSTKVESVNNKVEAMNTKFDLKFEAMNTRFDAKFDSVNTEIKAMNTKFDAKFEAMNTKFDAKFDVIAGKMDARWDSYAKLFYGSIVASVLVLAYAVSQDQKVVRMGALTERNSSIIDGMMSNECIKIRDPTPEGPKVFDK